MDRPLLISSILEHAEAQHGETQIVSRETHGPVFRYTFADCAARVKRLANALFALGLPAGDSKLVRTALLLRIDAELG